MESLVDTFGLLDHTKTEKISLEELQNYLMNHFNHDIHLQKFLKLFRSHGLMSLDEFCETLSLDINRVRQRLGYNGSGGQPALSLSGASAVHNLGQQHQQQQQQQQQQQLPPDSLRGMSNNAASSLGAPNGASSFASTLTGNDDNGMLSSKSNALNNSAPNQPPSLPIVTVRSLQTDPDLQKETEQKIIEIVIGEFRKGTLEKEVPERVKQQLDTQMSPLWHVLMIRGDYWSSHSYEPPNYITLGFGKYWITCWKTPIPQDM